MALTAATGWALDRLGVVESPLAGIEDTLIAGVQPQQRDDSFTRPVYADADLGEHARYASGGPSDRPPSDEFATCGMAEAATVGIGSQYTNQGLAWASWTTWRSSISTC